MDIYLQYWYLWIIGLIVATLGIYIVARINYLKRKYPKGTGHQYNYFCDKGLMPYEVKKRIRKEKGIIFKHARLSHFHCDISDPENKKYTYTMEYWV